LSLHVEMRAIEFKPSDSDLGTIARLVKLRDCLVYFLVCYLTTPLISKVM